MAQAEAELAAAVTEIEVTLLELKRERLLTQLGTSGSNDTSSPGSGDVRTDTQTGSTPAVPAHSGPQPGNTSGHSDIRIGQ